MNWNKICKLSLSKCFKCSWKQEKTTLVLSNSPKWMCISSKITLRIPWTKSTSLRKKLKRRSTKRIIRCVPSEQTSINLTVSRSSTNHKKKKCLIQSPKRRKTWWPRNMASNSNSKNSSWGNKRTIISDYCAHRLYGGLKSIFLKIIWFDAIKLKMREKRVDAVINHILLIGITANWVLVI